jgi:hypothetical protein
MKSVECIEIFHKCLYISSSISNQSPEFYGADFGGTPRGVIPNPALRNTKACSDLAGVEETLLIRNLGRELQSSWRRDKAIS